MSPAAASSTPHPLLMTPLSLSLSTSTSNNVSHLSSTQHFQFRRLMSTPILIPHLTHFLLPCKSYKHTLFITVIFPSLMFTNYRSFGPQTFLKSLAFNFIKRVLINPRPSSYIRPYPFALHKPLINNYFLRAVWFRGSGRK